MKDFAFPKSKQRGIAALFVAVLLLLAVTLLVMFASRVALLDQRTSANDYRHGQAFAMAEAGLEQAVAFLRENPILHEGDLAAVPGWESHAWTDCADVDLLPCDDASVQQVLVETVDGVARSGVREPLDPDTGDPVIPRTTAFLVRTDTGTLRGIGVGESDDRTGQSVVQVDFGRVNILASGDIPPLMSPLSDLGGNFTVVPNPNLGGPGVPISVWATDANYGKGTGTWQTCNHGDFRDQLGSGDVCMDTKADGATWKDCKCSEDLSGAKVGELADIVIYQTDDFPQPFLYAFGDPSDVDGLDPDNASAAVDAVKQEVEALAEVSGLVLTDCGTLDADFNGLVGSALVWVKGDCTINANTIIGSRDKPIILVVEQLLKVNGGAELWGVAVGLGEVDILGTAVFHGSLIAETSTDATLGGYTQVYDQGVFDSLLDDSINTQLAKLSYSWRDFRP